MSDVVIPARDLASLLSEDYSDEGRMLASVGGWAVGCENHLEQRALVERCEAAGFIGRRRHVVPVAGDPGWEAFELTDAGLERLRALCGEVVYRHAANSRDWYRRRAR